jgi:hypothetical protein
MKKYFIFLIIAVFLLTGCASAEDGAGTAQVQAASPDTTDQQAPSPEDAVTDEGGASQPGENPTSPEAPLDVKTVYGEISELIGNAVTVKLIEMPQPGMFEGRRMEVPLDEDGNPDYSQMELPEGVTVGEDGQLDFSQMELPEGMEISEDGRPDFSQMQRGEMPEGFTPGEGMPEGFTPGGGRGQAREGAGEAREPNYTGEVVDIIIPVGIPITTSSVGENGIETEEIQLDDIGIGDMITVVYKEDGVTINTVTVTPEGTVGGMGFPGGMMAFEMGDGAFFFNGGGPGGDGGVDVQVFEFRGEAGGQP